MHDGQIKDAKILGLDPGKFFLLFVFVLVPLVIVDADEHFVFAHHHGRFFHKGTFFPQRGGHWVWRSRKWEETICFDIHHDAHDAIGFGMVGVKIGMVLDERKNEDATANTQAQAENVE